MMTTKTGIAAGSMPKAVGRLRIERLNHLGLPGLRNGARANRHRNHQHGEKANYRSNPEFHLDNLLLMLKTVGACGAFTTVAKMLPPLEKQQSREDYRSGSPGNDRMGAYLTHLWIEASAGGR
jgi:hypothetical protein